MNAALTQIFGYIVVVASIVLFVWEYRTFVGSPDIDAWLVTRRRFRRRTVISAVLFMIGVLLVSESRGLFVLRLPIHLAIYVFLLTGLAIALLVLAAIDLSDTLRSASRQALVELESSIQAQRSKSDEIDVTSTDRE